MNTISSQKNVVIEEEPYKLLLACLLIILHVEKITAFNPYKGIKKMPQPLSKIENYNQRMRSTTSSIGDERITELRHGIQIA